MSPRNTSAAAVETNALLHGSSAEPASGSYECMLCGIAWSYAEIHNTARCPACGGGLTRDHADQAQR